MPKARLTPAEVRVLVLLCKGLASAQAAEVLKVSKRTVDFHISNMHDKTNARNRAQLVVWAVQNGVIAITPEGVVARGWA